MPYDPCGVGVVASVTTVGRSPPKTAIELEKSSRGRWPAVAAGVEEIARAVEIDAHAEIEVGLGRAADHGRQVDHRGRFLVDQRGHGCRVADVAGPVRDARVADPALGHVEADDARNGLGDHPAAVVGEFEAALPKQRTHQLLAEKAGAAGDEDFHVILHSMAALTRCR